MRNIKILHTADMHIGAILGFLKHNADSRRFETLITFERIMDLAAKENVEVVAIAGDLFDSNKVEKRFFEAVFKKIAAYPQIKVIFAAGNHDPLDSESPFLSYELPENLYVLGAKDERIVFEDLKLCVFGRSFENASLKGEESFSLKTDNSYINLLVQHGELKSDLNSEYNAITPAFVKNSGMDYIALGHVHKAIPVSRLANTYFAYSGCPEGQGFDELDEKGVYIGEIGKNVCDLKFMPVSLRRHIHLKVNIENLSSNDEISAFLLEKIKAELGDGYEENLYKIELIGEISNDTEIIVSEIESRLSGLLYFVKVKDSTELKLDLESIATDTGLKGVFVRKMLEKLELCDENEKEKYKNALKIGLKAFSGEVGYIED
ncbi:MAG: DNA repair exonuclease [Clostridia bacterium]|nr:DNA repair exonuclease [Clostridia bacterium]